MSAAIRALRLAVFAAGFLPYMILTGARFLIVRLLALASDDLAARITRRMMVRWNRFATWWAGVAAGVRVRIEGAPPAGQGHIIVSNHQSILDIPVLISTFGDAVPLFVTKAELARGLPNFSPTIRYAKFAVISRKKGSSSDLEAIERLGRRLAPERVSAVIFPEGHRSRDGALLPFKAGGLAILLRSAPGARVVPVAIDGTRHAVGFTALLTKFTGLEIRLRVGPAIDVNPAERATEEGARAVAERCRAFCQGALDEWRAPQAS